MEAKTPIFKQVKLRIYQQILDGIYDLGVRFPTEASLCSEFKASRVTIRKALDELKAERVISSVQGQGTVVTLDRNVSKNALDTVAIIANARDHFFGTFLDAFDKHAVEENALIVYRSHQSDELADTFKVLHARGIRNVVLWPNQGFDDADLLHRLRLLGMNLVFFDHIYDSPDIDCVVLDNQDAIASLYTYLKSQGHKRIHYLGWNNVPLSSTAERTKAFRQLDSGTGNVFEFSRNEYLDQQIEAYFLDCKNKQLVADAILCGNGDLALSMSRMLDKQNDIHPQLVCVDEFPRVKIPNLVCYAQPMESLAEQVFQCLVRQNNPQLQWSAQSYRMKGLLLS